MLARPGTKVSPTIVQLFPTRGSGVIASSHPIQSGAFSKSSSERKQDMFELNIREWIRRERLERESDKSAEMGNERVPAIRACSVEGAVMFTATQSASERELSRCPRKAADQGLCAALDSKKPSSAARHFEEALRKKIVGQDEAVQALVDLYQVFCAGLHSPGRPVGNLLFLGPKGSGKTRPS